MRRGGLPLVAAAAAFEDEHWHAEAIAAAAGDLLLNLRDRPIVSNNDEFRRRADRLANRFIIDELGRRFPFDPVLSEEEPDRVAARVASRRVWIVDPLDGTWNFAEGRDDWAVHVALSIDGEVLVGAIALPAQGIILSTRRMIAPRRRRSCSLRFVVSRDRPPRRWTGFPPGAEVVALGSAGAKTAAVITGDADVYVHDEGMHEWDAAAPVAVALSHGLHVSRLDGGPVVFNRENPFIDDLIISRHELASGLLRTPVEPTTSPQTPLLGTTESGKHERREGPRRKGGHDGSLNGKQDG